MPFVSNGIDKSPFHSPLTWYRARLGPGSPSRHCRHRPPSLVRPPPAARARASARLPRPTIVARLRALRLVRASSRHRRRHCPRPAVVPGPGPSTVVPSDPGALVLATPAPTIAALAPSKKLTKKQAVAPLTTVSPTTGLPDSSPACTTSSNIPPPDLAPLPGSPIVHGCDDIPPTRQTDRRPPELHPLAAHSVSTRPSPQ